MLNYNPSWFKCKLYNFLIYLIASALFLSGCDIQKEHHANISEDIVSPIQQASFCTNIFAAVSDEAMYYQIKGGKLFALDKKGNNIQIGSIILWMIKKLVLAGMGFLHQKDIQTLRELVLECFILIERFFMRVSILL